jgi:hypothetical protein
VLSIVTPRLRTFSDNVIKSLPSVTAFTVPLIRGRTFVPMTMASDLSGFSDKPFNINQFVTAAIHVKHSVVFVEHDV